MRRGNSRRQGKKMVPETGLEPVWLKPLDFESSASANSATSAFQGSDSFGTSSIILELHPFVNSFLEYFSRNFVLKLSLYNIKKQISQSLSALIIFNITSKLGKHHNNVRPSSQ